MNFKKLAPKNVKTASSRSSDALVTRGAMSVRSGVRAGSSTPYII